MFEFVKRIMATHVLLRVYKRVFVHLRAHELESLKLIDILIFVNPTSFFRLIHFHIYFVYYINTPQKETNKRC